MAGKEIPRLLARFFNRGQRTRGGNNMTKCEERLHALLFVASAASNFSAGTPALARCAQVLEGRFGPACPELPP